MRGLKGIYKDVGVMSRYQEGFKGILVNAEISRGSSDCDLSFRVFSVPWVSLIQSSFGIELDYVLQIIQLERNMEESGRAPTNFWKIKIPMFIKKPN